MHFTYDCCRVVNACKVMQQDHEQGSARQHISCFLWSCAFSCFFAKEHRLAHLASFFFFFGTFGYTYTIENVYSILHSVTVHMVTGAEWHASVAFHVKFLLVQWRCFEFASSNTEKKKSHFPAFVLLMLLSAGGCYTRDFYVAKYYGMG